MIGKSSPQEIATFAIIWEISDSNAETWGYSPKSRVSQINGELTALPSQGQILGEGAGGVHPPPGDDLRFSNTTGILACIRKGNKQYKLTVD